MSIVSDKEMQKKFTNAIDKYLEIETKSALSSRILTLSNILS
jgi:hypothetical protein